MTQGQEECPALMIQRNLHCHIIWVLSYSAKEQGRQIITCRSGVGAEEEEEGGVRGCTLKAVCCE